MNLVKLPFLLINLLFLLISLSLVGLGIFILSDETIIERVIFLSNLTEILKLSSKTARNGTDYHYPDEDPLFLQNVTDPISYLLILIGGSLFFLSFIGYCGAVKDSRCLVALFGVVLALVCLAEGVGLGLYFFVYKPDIKSYLAEGIKHHYNPDEYPSGPGTRFTVILDYLMIEHKCCGINGDSDFHPIYQRLVNHGIKFPGSAQAQLVPEACCHLNITDFREVNAIYESILMKDRPELDVDHQNSPNSPSLVIRNRKELLEFADDPRCLAGTSKEWAYLGEENGCFDKIQTDWGQLVGIAGVVLGVLQLSGVVFSIFVFKAAYYDYHE